MFRIPFGRVIRFLIVLSVLYFPLSLPIQSHAQNLESTLPPAPVLEWPEQTTEQPSEIQAGTISWGATNVSAAESRSIIWLQVRLVGNTTETSFSYRTQEGTAGASTDYVTRDVAVTVPANQRYVYIGIQLVANAVVESKETFTVHLYGLTGLTLQGSASVSVDIYERLYGLPQIRAISSSCTNIEDQNDNPLTAGYIGGGLHYPTACNGSFDGEAVTESDYFRILVEGTLDREYTMKIDLFNMTVPAAHNLDLILYELNQNNQLVAVGSSQAPNQQTDSLTVILKQGRTYYLRVYWGNANNATKPIYKVFTAIQTPINP